jgi:PhnB protein
MTMYIPDGYGTMFPYLFVNDAGQYIEFLKNAFGAEVLGVTKMPSGEIANARVRIGTTGFMLSEARGEQLKPSASAFYLYVEDANVAFKRALLHGARQMFEPMDMPYGDRQGGVTDPEGNIWFVSTRFQHQPYDAPSAR